MTPFIAELIGTFLLILLGNGVVANVLLRDTKGHNGGLIVITAGWAMAVFVGVFVTADISGAHLNPAITIGLAAAGKMMTAAGTIDWATIGSYILAQMLGAMLGTTTVWLVYRDHYNRTEDGGLQRATFCTDPAIRHPLNNLIAEFVGTFVLMFAALYALGPSIEANGLEGAKIGLGAIGALPIAFVVFGIGMSLGGPTGYAINPARDLGPRIMHAILPLSHKADSDWGYAWIPVVGPILGALAAGGLFVLLS